MQNKMVSVMASKKKKFFFFFLKNTKTNLLESLVTLDQHNQKIFVIKKNFFSLFRNLSRKKCQVSTYRQCQDFRQRPNFGRKGRPTLVNTIQPSESFTLEMYSQDGPKVILKFSQEDCIKSFRVVTVYIYLLGWAHTHIDPCVKSILFAITTLQANHLFFCQLVQLACHC